MQKIHHLSKTLIAKIKAGEVIERPSYAVKELLENAIDAGATTIHVDLETSGLKKIIVTDNGEGMSKKDLELCFLPHTTSKLKDEHGLLSIQTLGFRGEALSSIAAISNLTIQSRTIHEPIGNKVELKAGIAQRIEPFGMPQGTRVIIEDIFGFVPVRKKFLKSLRTEYRHSIDAILHTAVTNPTIRFYVTHNKRPVLDLPPADTLSNRLPYLIGNHIFQHTIPVTYTNSYISISGFLGKPHLSFSNQQRQFLFVNNRPVTDRGISIAVKEAFSTMLDSGSYPLFILFISLPPDLVDANVHPRKEQIRFINQQMVFDAVKQAATQALQENNITFANISWATDFNAPGKTTSFAGMLLKDAVLSHESITNNVMLDSIQQIHTLYILLETPKGLVIIDQHAAHERILFEKLHKEFLKLKNKTKPTKLKKPLPFTFSTTDYAILQQEKKYFAKLGFGWKNANQNSIILTCVPHLLKDRNPEDLLVEMISDMQSEGTTKNIDRQSHTMLAFLACRSAVKAGDILTKKQMKELIKQLQEAENNSTCPHGRPTRIEIALLTLNRTFKRN